MASKASSGFSSPLIRDVRIPSGRGWAALQPDGTLEGHIYFHLGDDSAFRAERFNGVVQ